MEVPRDMTSFPPSLFKAKMALQVDEVTNSLIFEHLKKFNKDLAQVFKKSKKCVSILHTHVNINVLKLFSVEI